jgi:hypothetical protein
MTNLAQTLGLPKQFSNLPVTSLLLIHAILKCQRRGCDDPPMRRLASMCGRKVRCVQMHKKALIASGHLIVTRRRIGHKQCLTDVYEIPGFSDGGAGAKGQEKSLKTNTKTKASSPPAAATRPAPDVNRVLTVKLAAAEEQTAFWKSKAMREENQNRKQAEFFRAYIRRGEHQANGRLWAWAKIQEQARMRQRAFVGMPINYSPPQSVP